MSGGLGACWAATPLVPATRTPPLLSMPLKEAQDVQAMLEDAARRGNQGGELDPLVLRLPSKFADLAAEAAAEAAAAVEIELAVPGGAAPAGQRLRGAWQVEVGPWG